MSVGRARQAAYMARKRAAGYRIVQGRWTLEPPRQSPPPHGTPARYRSKSHPCNCAECRASWAALCQQWREANRERWREISRRAGARYRAKQRGA